MIFFHGTNKKNWLRIQQEGILWGGDTWYHTGGKKGYRYTYLTPDVEIARKYGDIVLEVNYEPKGVGNGDNFGFNPPPGQTCWQFSVFVPISISCIKKVEKHLAIGII
ncbi:hypothetical protein LCGC14_1192500 [marine sediment metagenome]|uniref:PARP catalytic domain-containing protein n=1 Tax=marine sediment metagenome TaxID=412755 RepID=A0A0F9LJ58_9ZZZZ